MHKLSTGVRSLNRCCGGLIRHLPLELVGGEGVGKTALCVAVAESCKDCVVLWFSSDVFPKTLISACSHIVLIEGATPISIDAVCRETKRSDERSCVVGILDSIASLPQCNTADDVIFVLDALSLLDFSVCTNQHRANITTPHKRVHGWMEDVMNKYGHPRVAVNRRKQEVELTLLRHPLLIPGQSGYTRVVDGKVDQAEEMLVYLLQAGTMTQRGPHFFYNSSRVAVGRDAAREWVRLQMTRR